MRVLLIINPKAGSSSRNQVDILSWLTQLTGHTLTVEVPRDAEDATTIARHGVEAGYDRILAAGGDGTINRVVSALAETDIPLGIIPIGTVNVLARELCIPLDPLKALQIALGNRTRCLDLGVANGQYFTLMAGMGFDAKVVSEIVPRLKELFGSLAYVTAGLQTLARHKPSQFYLTFDGKTIRFPAWLLVVGNASYYTYQLSIASGARMDDGLLDIIVFGEQNALDRLTQIGAVVFGQHVKHPNIRYFQAPALSIAAEPRVHVQLDGDSVGKSPVEISVKHGALQVMVPERTGDCGQY
ncbi:MAG: diacylglycerol/lipid kinase family protein [Armatimonadota bacterium]